ncbi:hypothetical protein RF55_26600, partial [Lasius niger]
MESEELPASPIPASGSEVSEELQASPIP